MFRAIEEEAGRDSEFYQTGVELIGDASSEADAEVVALAIASLQAAGVGTFKIALGHVGFLNGLFQETLEGRRDAQLSLKEHLLVVIMSATVKQLSRGSYARSGAGVESAC